MKPINPVLWLQIADVAFFVLGVGMLFWSAASDAVHERVAEHIEFVFKIAIVLLVAIFVLSCLAYLADINTPVPTK